MAVTKIFCDSHFFVSMIYKIENPSNLNAIKPIFIETLLLFVFFSQSMLAPKQSILTLPQWQLALPQ